MNEIFDFTYKIQKNKKCVKVFCARNYFEFRMQIIYPNWIVWVCWLFDDSHLLISLKYDKWLVRFCFYFMLWSYVSMFKLALSRFWSFFRWRPIVNSRAFTALITEFPVWRCTRSQTFVPRFYTLSQFQMKKVIKQMYQEKNVPKQM